ncbi:MAG: hypothetical protein GX224_00155 [Thermoplasmatales archaeon]|nr:hypothetical protein [Thermoplasmatales archaeon]
MSGSGSEFSLKKADPGGAVLGMVGAIASFIIVPLCLCALIVGIIEASIRSGTSFMEAEQVESLIEEYWYYTRRFISLAGPLVLVSIPMGLYPKGSYARIPFGLFFGFYLALVLLIFVHGGAVTTDVGGLGGSGGVSIDAVRLTLNVTAIMYIAVMISVAKGFLTFAEFAAHRKDYLKWLDEKDEKKAKKAKASETEGPAETVGDDEVEIIEVEEDGEPAE